MQHTENLRIRGMTRLAPPRETKISLPLSAAASETVVQGRREVEKILNREDSRLLVIVGPCSIHDPKGALEYARRLVKLRHELSDHFAILMRVYFEKPRTTVGWKGLINDPHLDGSCDIAGGLKIARELLLQINELGMPAATEFLEGITPQYIADLVSWAAIGARTTESQTHRQMASGLSMPVGFKNGTDGSLQVAVDAMTSASHPHYFLGIDEDGVTSIVQTSGNPNTHVILRGGRTRTNYDADSIAEAAAQLKKAGLRPDLMVDCSHANSEKKHEQQEVVWQNLIRQRIAGSPHLTGVMIESYLNGGAQPFPQPVDKLKYGVSITDACISWETTETLLRWGYAETKANATVMS